MAVFGAWCYLFVKDPVYEIRARLLFEGRNISAVMQQRPQSDSTGTLMSDREKLEVLTSRTLIEHIVR